MSIRDLRLDEETWQRATSLRRAEWRSAIEDLLHESIFAEGMHGLHLLATFHQDHVLVEGLDDEGFVRSSVVITLASVDEFVKEYLEIIERLDEGAGHRDSTWLLAVDMAKKVVHDKAAKTLASTVPELSQDHATLRKVFTLVFSLAIDTTKMTSARIHRR